MHWNEQKELFNKIVEDERYLLEEKGREYASDKDSLANFKSKMDIGVNPLQVAMIFMDKHYSSIKSYVKTGKELSNESIESRIADMRNYLFLMYALIKERESGENSDYKI